MNGWSILRGLLTGIDIDLAMEKGRYKNDADVDGARRALAMVSARRGQSAPVGNPVLSGGGFGFTPILLAASM